MVEHHARDLPAYYRALTVHPHHNYYFGRSEADLTPWLEYFTFTLAEVFEAVRRRAERYVAEGVGAELQALRRLDRRARIVLGLFAKKETITSTDATGELGLSGRMARNLLADWVKDGWLVVIDTSRRARSYGLSAKYRQYVGSLSAMPER